MDYIWESISHLLKLFKNNFITLLILLIDILLVL